MQIKLHKKIRARAEYVHYVLILIMLWELSIWLSQNISINIPTFGLNQSKILWKFRDDWWSELENEM